MKIRTQADIAELEKLPVGERIRHKNVREIFQDSRARRAERVAFRVGGKGPAPAGVVDFEAALDRQPGDKLLAPKTLERDTLAALFHTGGTTGLPKLARHTHGALALAAWSNMLMFDLEPGAVQINPLPQFHVGGSIVGGLSPIANGW